MTMNVAHLHSVFVFLMSVFTPAVNHNLSPITEQLECQGRSLDVLFAGRRGQILTTN